MYVARVYLFSYGFKVSLDINIRWLLYYSRFKNRIFAKLKGKKKEIKALHITSKCQYSFTIRKRIPKGRNVRQPKAENVEPFCNFRASRHRFTASNTVDALRSTQQLDEKKEMQEKYHHHHQHNNHHFRQILNWVINIF